MNQSKKVPVCLYEDRAECALGVKLLVLSARRHEPDWMIHAFMRNLKVEDMNWLADQPNVTLRDEVDTLQRGWNVKPFLMKILLEETGGEVIWCDSDIILAARVTPILESIPSTTFVATEEHCWGRTKGSLVRTTGWNLHEARRINVSVNSCFMRMNPTHGPLLDAWNECLSRPDYLHAQRQPWDQRPVYFIGDQDALTALLASSEFLKTPYFLFRSGIDIAQCFEEDGYTFHHRLINSIRRRVPPLVHAQGGKPWRSGSRSIDQQLSPYSRIALPYASGSSLPVDWINPDSLLLRTVDSITFRDPNLRGLLPALRRTLQRSWKHRNRLFNYLKFVKS